MMNSWLICRSAATLGAEPAPRIQGTGSLWVSDEDVPQPRSSRRPRTINGVTLVSVVGEPEFANIQPPEDPEAAAAEARRQWKSRFRARVRMMEKLLANAPDDNVPTPRGDGDH